MTTGLVLFDRARTALAEAHAIDEVKEIRDQAAALRAYYQQRDGSLEMANQCAEIKLRAERRLGELLAETVEPGRPKSSDNTRVSKLPPGISYDQSSDWQALARIPEQDFEAHIAERKEAGEPITTAGALRLSVPHVSHNSGENEWYTPPEFIDAARRVMGGIDLDPASSPTANSVVKAERFYTIRDDGLRQPWAGRLWLNPPYSADLIGKFAQRFADEFDRGNVESAVVLVNNATETDWFGTMVIRASAVCFPSRRIRFWSPSGTLGAPLQGQALLYFGPDAAAFIEAFESFGWIGLVVR